MTTRPNAAEFKMARVLAERPDNFGEQAYQICRWYRGQMFIRDDAEAALTAIRNDTVPKFFRDGGALMTREFKVGERLKIYPTSDRTYTSDCTVKQIIPEGGAAGGGIVVVYDKPILGVRPTQTFRPEILAKQIKGSAA